MNVFSWLMEASPGGRADTGKDPGAPIFPGTPCLLCLGSTPPNGQAARARSEVDNVKPVATGPWVCQEPILPTLHTKASRVRRFGSQVMSLPPSSEAMHVS